MATVFALPHAVRDMRRYIEILGVLIRYGFGDVVQETKLDRLLEKGRTLAGFEAAPAHAPLTKAARLRRAMEELGPTFIKLGQLLSTRPDLVPQSWADEFKGLQGNCAAIPFDAIRARLESEFPGRLDDLFARIDETPLATASIAQVHRATLRDGTALLLKIVRPGTEEVLAADFAILETLAQLSEQHFSRLGYSPTEVVEELHRSVRRELDLVHEGRSTDRFREIFADDPSVVFPRVYWQVTTTAVLGVEEIAGAVLSQVDFDAIPAADRRALVTNGARAVFKQCLEVGFFHADPHPGNLIALPGGRIAFIDCGMTGHLDGETMQRLGDLAAGVVRGDMERVIAVVAALSDAKPGKVEERAFRVDVRDFVAHFEHTPLRSLHMAALLRELFDKLREHNLRCAADLVLLIKALTTIESVGRQLDPDFDMVAFAEPYVTELVDRRWSATALAGRAGQTVRAYAELAERLPYDLGHLLTQIRRSKLAVSLEHRGLTRLTDTVEHASRNISFALIIAALLVSSAILVLAGRDEMGSYLPNIGLCGMAIAGVMIVLRIIANRRRPR